jgi:hypothetical protein
MNNKVLIQKIFLKDFKEIFFNLTLIKNNKARQEMHGLCYMDGLVSTGNKFPYTILKIIFTIRKNISIFLSTSLKGGVDKHEKNNLQKVLIVFLHN